MGVVVGLGRGNRPVTSPVGGGAAGGARYTRPRLPAARRAGRRVARRAAPVAALGGISWTGRDRRAGLVRAGPRRRGHGAALRERRGRDADRVPRRRRTRPPRVRATTTRSAARAAGHGCGTLHPYRARGVRRDAAFPPDRARIVG